MSTFQFSTHVYKNSATKFVYRFCIGCFRMSFFSALVNKKIKNFSVFFFFLQGRTFEYQLVKPSIVNRAKPYHSQS